MNIKELRIKTGMSRREFHEEFGIPARTLESWEKGERTAPDYAVKLLSDAVESYCNEKEFENVCKQIDYYMSCIYDFAINRLEAEKHRLELVEYLKALPAKKIVRQYSPTKWEYNPDNLDWWSDKNTWTFEFSDVTEKLREVIISFKTCSGHVLEKHYTYRK